MARTGVGTVCLALCCVLCFAQGDVNVALDKSYSQSSTYQSQRSADIAANGDTSGNFPKNCMHSNDTSQPWYQVDLQRIYPLYEISVWARYNFRDRLVPSNITVDGNLCVDIPTFFGASRRMDVNCSEVMYGQRVRITRENDEKYLNMCEIEIWVPDGLDQCPAGKYGTSCNQDCNEHCGQGTGKNFCYQNSGNCYDGCVDGWYGEQCSTKCSTGCKDDSCDEVTGACQCKDHFQGNKCTECVDGRYGSVCDTTCPTIHCHQCERYTGVCTNCNLNSNLQLPDCADCVDGYYQRPNNTVGCDECVGTCKAETVCDKTTGYCPVCPPGKQGHYCDTDCDPGRYGQNCTEECGHCLQGQPTGHCHPVTGHCIYGCQDGWQPSTCTEECEDGSWGAGCLETCVQCKEGTVCNKVNGHCPLCEPGWYPPTCNIPCQDGWYGDSCSHECGSCIDDTVCNKVTGHCPVCTRGKQPPLCADDCQGNTYGENCSETCGQCREGQTCDPGTGQCSEGCQPGWTDPPSLSSLLCQTACQDGWYGDSCSHQCGSCIDDTICNKVTGHCPVCTRGKQPPLCADDCQSKTYGKNCSETCGQCTGGQMCDPVTGQCSEGCQPGWTDPPSSPISLCQTECPVGLYGEDCNQTCGYCRVITECRHDTGHCTGQCAEGFTGLHCAERQKDEKDKSTIIIGTGVGLFFLSVCIVIGVIIWVLRSKRRSRQSRNKENDASTRASPSPFRPATTADREPAETVFQKPPDDGNEYMEILEEMPISARNVSLKPSDLHDIKVYKSDTSKPYDRPAVQYQNTGDVYLYE